jgi:glutamate/tyrosine decarboxylase-like PLP-dependent enzyme
MNPNFPLQDVMFRELAGKELFEQVQTYGHAYLDEVFNRAVFPTEKALDELRHFEEPLPERPGEAGVVIELLQRYGAPATVAQLGGRYFGFVNGSVVPAGLAAKQLASFWDQNAAMYVMSPIASQLETVVEGWLRELFGLPAATVASYVSGTSMANFCGMAAARYRLLKRQGWDINEKGLSQAPPLRIVAGAQAHTAVVRAVGLLGFGKANVEWVEADEEGRMIASRVPELDDRTMLILQAGNVNSGAFDPLQSLCEKAAQANAWVHVDGAFGLWAAASDTLRTLTRGIETATSLAADGHKTLNTPYDCGILMCQDKEALASALHLAGSYLVLDEKKRDGMLYTPEMSRRARIIELWATMKYLGRSGMGELVDHLHARAVQFASAIRGVPGFGVLNDVVFNQVLVCCETDAMTIRTLTAIQELRECWVGGSVFAGRKVIRVSVSSWATTADDIERTVRAFEQGYRMATA